MKNGYEGNQFLQRNNNSRWYKVSRKKEIKKERRKPFLSLLIFSRHRLLEIEERKTESQYIITITNLGIYQKIPEMVNLKQARPAIVHHQ